MFLTKQQQHNKRILLKQADDLEKKAQQLWDVSGNNSHGMGQPILVGHHSEKASTRHHNSQNNKMFKASELRKKEEALRFKANRTYAIKLNNNDREAKSITEQKISFFEALQSKMKETNKIVRNKKLSPEEKVNQIKLLNITSEELQFFFVTISSIAHEGFNSGYLTSINNKIKYNKNKLNIILKGKAA